MRNLLRHSSRCTHAHIAHKLVLIEVHVDTLSLSLAQMTLFPCVRTHFLTLLFLSLCFPSTSLSLSQRLYFFSHPFDSCLSFPLFLSPSLHLSLSLSVCLSTPPSLPHSQTDGMRGLANFQSPESFQKSDIRRRER